MVKVKFFGTARVLLQDKEMEGDFKNVKEMLEENPINVSFTHKEFDVCNFPEFHGISYDEAVKKFKKHFTEWAIKKYGSKENAARELGCCSKTLGNQ